MRYRSSGVRVVNKEVMMLVLSRRPEEKIIIGDTITVMVLEIRGDKVRLGIEAPDNVSIHREEVHAAIQRAAASAPQSPG